MTLILSLVLETYDGNYVKDHSAVRTKDGVGIYVEWCNSQSSAATTEATNQNVDITQSPG